MKVLIVSRYKKNYPTHIVPFVEEQGRALKEQGVDVTFFQIRGSYFRTSELRKKIKEIKPDIIHAHYGLSGITAVLQSKVPVIITFHNGETLNFFVNFISSLFSLRAKHIIYVAQHIYDKCIFKRKDRFSILPCGVDLKDCKITDKDVARKELGFKDDKKYILFGGAFDNLRKNYPLLKEAIKLLENKDRIVCMEMKGMSRQQITKIMCACDIFALPSKSEGSPQALKEAMACNCPIVATNVADIKHLLGDVPGHYLCSFDVLNVAEKIREALDFSGRTEGRERIIALGLTNDCIAQRLIEIYQRIV